MKRLILYCSALLLLACNKPGIENPDCEKLIMGIADNNELAVKTEIEKLTTDLLPDPRAEDQLGHTNNLQKLSERLNSKCSSLTSSVECYACAYSHPPISELKLEFTLEGTMYTATIDIFTPEDDILRYAGMHYFIGSDN